MNPRSVVRFLPRIVLIFLGLSLNRFNYAQQENNDPWFQQQAERDASGTNDLENANQPTSSKSQRASSEKAYRTLLKEFEKTPAYALTKRMELLKRAASSGASNGDDAVTQLRLLESTLEEISHAIDEAADLPSPKAALERLATYKRYFQADIQLSKRLVDSPLTDRIDKSIARASNDRDAEKLVSLQNAIQTSGLSHVFGSMIETALLKTQAELIQQKWIAANNGQSIDPSDQFLIRKTLGQTDTRLPVSIQINNYDDPRFLNAFQGSVSRQLGNVLELQSYQSANLSIILTVDDFKLEEEIDQSSIASVIPGAIEEKENPEFVDLLAKYKEQAEKYETALRLYKRDHDDWIRNYKDDNGQLANDVEAAEENMEAALVFASRNSDPFTGPSPEAMNRMELANIELRQARNMSTSAQVQNRPEPIPPTPVHLNTLEQVYATPSVIVTQSENEDYSYTRQDVLTTFQSAASLSLASSDSLLPNTASAELVRDRNWIRNLGVDSRDPSASQGDYSQEAVDSTKDLFYLEFASVCAAKLEKLLQSTSATLLGKALDSGDRKELMLALSLKASSENFTLSASDRSRLFALANDPSVGAHTLKNEFLESLVKTAFASSQEEQRKAFEIITQ